MTDVRQWTLSRIVGRDGRPRTGWAVGMPDEWPEHCSVEPVSVVPASALEGAVDALLSPAAIKAATVAYNAREGHTHQAARIERAIRAAILAVERGQ